MGRGCSRAVVVRLRPGNNAVVSWGGMSRKGGARASRSPARGEKGFVTAAVIAPFGNVLGIMYPHYLDVLKSSGEGVTRLEPRSLMGPPDRACD